MSFTINSSGLYTYPNGSDILWNLSQHLAQLNTSKNIRILLPTQRSVNRFNGILKKNKTPLNVIVSSYNDFLSNEDKHQEHLLLWKVCNTPEVSNFFLKTESPQVEQKLGLLKHLHSVLSELELHEITPNTLEITLRENGSLNHAHYVKVFKAYLSLLSKHSVLSIAQQQSQHYTSLTLEVESSSNTLWYIVIDGPTPPGIMKLSAEIAKQGVVLLKASESTKSTARHVNFTPNILDVFLPRRQLQKALNSSHFFPITYEKDWQNISCIECNNPLQLASNVVDIANKHFKEGNKVVTLITPNREIAKLVKQIAEQSGVAVDDSFGTSLKNHPAVSLLHSALKWLETPHNHVWFLEVFTHYFAPINLRSIAQKVDILARDKQLSLSVAIQTYVPENDEEAQGIKLIEKHLNSSLNTTFKDLLSMALDILLLYTFPESYKEVINILKETVFNVGSLTEFELLIEVIPYQEKSPALPLLQIIGPLEARLLNPKVSILADLNEYDWPLPLNPLWLPRNVANQLGLPRSQDISTLSSEVLLSLLGSPYVYLLRTRYADNIETTPSRWWVRLNTLAKLSNKTLIQSKMEASQSVVEPASNFTLPTKLRPHKISISQLQQYIQNPSEFVTETLLNAPVLPEWYTKADHRDKGILLHDVFNHAVQENLSKESSFALVNKKLQHLNLSDVDYIFWKEELELSVTHFYKLHEATHPVKTWTELKGEWVIDTDFGPITVVGKADRIDKMQDGSLHIVDYKTGSLPTKKDILSGQFPQLTILGLMLQNSAFTSIPAQAPFLVSYWGVKDGSTMSILFEELKELEGSLLQTVSSLLDPATQFKL